MVMYTSNAYFPSPIDGNYYPTYIQLSDGQLAPVHFLRTQEGESNLVIFQPAPFGQAPQFQPVSVYISNGFSNLVYFQPQNFGFNQLLYCPSTSNQHLVLLMNTQLQQFLPVEVYDSIIRLTESVGAISNSMFMKENPYKLPVIDSVALPDEIIRSLQALQIGMLRNVSINSNQFGFSLTAEDNNGDRVVFEKYSRNGITSSNVTRVTPFNEKEHRQEQVRQLRAQKMTQAQIANHLGVSQKTVSNDLRELKLN